MLKNIRSKRVSIQAKMDNADLNIETDEFNTPNHFDFDGIGNNEIMIQDNQIAETEEIPDNIEQKITNNAPINPTTAMKKISSPSDQKSFMT